MVSFNTYWRHRQRLLLWAIVLLIILCSLISSVRDTLDQTWSVLHHVSCESGQQGCSPKDPIPSEYTVAPLDQRPFCNKQFGMAYLEGLRDRATEYCTSNSSSSLVCYHTHKTPDRPVGSFCLGRRAQFDSRTSKYKLDCDLVGWNESEMTEYTPPYPDFGTYWYNTGPGVVFTSFIDRVEHTEEERGARAAATATALPAEPSRHTILVKREGSHNPWHSLLEIMSMTMSIDVLRMDTRNADTEHAVFGLKDINNTQVVFLDDNEQGPYSGLWSLFAKRPPMRLENMHADDMQSENIIVPLAGASNPLWQGDWITNPCRSSSLLSVFANRVLDHYGFLDQPRDHEEGEIVVTYIDRKSSRRLTNHTEYLDSIRENYPHITVQSIDFTSIPFHEQLAVIRGTDILPGRSWGWLDARHVPPGELGDG
jgi:protein O-GlcNAc transferase